MTVRFNDCRGIIFHMNIMSLAILDLVRQEEAFSQFVWNYQTLDGVLQRSHHGGPISYSSPGLRKKQPIIQGNSWPC